jgi:peptide/nickel transport system ATP-binding protein
MTRSSHPARPDGACPDLDERRAAVRAEPVDSHPAHAAYAAQTDAVVAYPDGAFTGPPLLDLDCVGRDYALPRSRLFAAPPVVHAVAGVSLQVRAGRSLGVVGESGSGKSTLARLAMALEPPTSGRVRFLGQDLNALPPAALRRARRDFQMVFQDPYGSLDPRQRVARIVAEPLRAQRGLRDAPYAQRAPASTATAVATAAAAAAAAAIPADGERERVAEALAAVGLSAADAASKYPHEFSGGQRQRIAIARALVTRPKLIVADEPVSALDVSVQAQVLNLLADLAADHGVTYLFISHDLGVVDHVCDEVAVMYRGRVVEQGPADVLLRRAAHPYTRALLAAVPRAEPPARHRLPAAKPAAAATTIPPRSPHSPPACAYAPRCPHASERCAVETPLLRPVGAAWAACHHAERVVEAATAAP